MKNNVNSNVINEQRNFSSKNNIKHTKSELLDIYYSAKKGQYDLNKLELSEIQLLNKMLKEEIKIKTRKLSELIKD